MKLSSKRIINANGHEGGKKFLKIQELDVA